MLRLELVLLGKTKDRYIDDGIADFTGRLARYAHVRLAQIKVGRLSNRSDAEIIQHESRLLDKHIRPGSYRCVLDASGKQIRSEEFADLFIRLEENGVREISFIIGGHLGLSREQLTSADYVLSLSKMTFTHDMVRLLLLEQIYRAFMIRAGTKYHK
jgi:23S rRNA (pseudouridine1915-N3)-methyltransferase